MRVLELAGIGPCPFAAMVLADLGADVLRLDRVSSVPGAPPQGTTTDFFQRGKRSLGVDLKRPEAMTFVLELVGIADALVEGFRPGVMERLGLGPDECLQRNPRLVYGRMTGWGQSGTLSQRAGHDIDYIALSGTLSLIGRQGEPPVPPLNLVGDFGGGGMLLALGVVAALLSAGREGRGQVVDTAMVDGAALLAMMLWSLRAAGAWQEERGVNLLDTGAPFYEVYECADGKYLAVGALEPQFFQQLIGAIGAEGQGEKAQNDRSWWPEGKTAFAELFRTKTRDEWVDLTEHLDACVAPVLSMSEAPSHPHNMSRQTFVEVEGEVQPSPAPRFSGTPAKVDSSPCWPGEGGREALSEWGVPSDRVRELEEAGSLRLLG